MRKDRPKVPNSLILKKSDQWLAPPLREYLKYLPIPGQNFNEVEFAIRGLLLLEAQLDEYIKERGHRPKPFFAAKLSQAKRIGATPEEAGTFEAIDLFKDFRNVFAHEINPRSKTKPITDNLIQLAEQTLRLQLDDWVPERHSYQWKLFLAFTLVWESTCRARGAPASFSLVRPIFAELHRARTKPIDYPDN